MIQHEDNGKKGSFYVEENGKLLAEMVWPHFWAIQILLSVLILIYCVMNELARVVGRRELRAMFFGPWPGGARTAPPQR